MRPQPDDDKQNLNARIDVVLPNLESDNPRQNAKLLTDLARETGGKYLPIEKAAAELPALLPDRGERFAVDEQLAPCGTRNGSCICSWDCSVLNG